MIIDLARHLQTFVRVHLNNFPAYDENWRERVIQFGSASSRFNKSVAAVQLNAMFRREFLEPQLLALLSHAEGVLGIKEWGDPQKQAICLAYRHFLWTGSTDFKKENVALAWLSSNASSPAGGYYLDPSRQRTIHKVISATSKTTIKSPWPPIAVPPIFQYIVKERLAEERDALAGVRLHSRPCLRWKMRTNWNLCWRRFAWLPKPGLGPKSVPIYLQHLFYCDDNPRNIDRALNGEYPVFEGGMTHVGKVVLHMDFDLLSVGVITQCSCGRGPLMIESFGLSFEHGTGEIVNAIYVERMPLTAWAVLRNDSVYDYILSLF